MHTIMVHLSLGIRDVPFDENLWAGGGNFGQRLQTIVSAWKYVGRRDLRFLNARESFELRWFHHEAARLHRENVYDWQARPRQTKVVAKGLWVCVGASKLRNGPFRQTGIVAIPNYHLYGRIRLRENTFLVLRYHPRTEGRRTEYNEYALPRPSCILFA